MAAILDWAYNVSNLANYSIWSADCDINLINYSIRFVQQLSEANVNIEAVFETSPSPSKLHLI